MANHGGLKKKLSFEYSSWLQSAKYAKANEAHIEILAFDMSELTVALSLGDINEAFQIGFRFWPTYPADLTEDRLVISIYYF